MQVPVATVRRVPGWAGGAAGAMSAPLVYGVTSMVPHIHAITVMSVIGITAAPFARELVRSPSASSQSSQESMPNLF